jgi:hypothetical protein
MVRLLGARSARRSNRIPTASAVAIWVVVCGVVPAGRSAFEPQTLTGTTLQPVEDTEAVISDVLDRFLGHGSRDDRGAIDRVLVSADSPERLALTVNYSGFANCRLLAEPRDRVRRPQYEIRSEPVQLTSADGEAAIVLTVPDGMGDGGPIQSAYLRLTAECDRASLPAFSRTYRLPKRWRSTGDPATSVQKIAPQPIGTAATLGARPDYAPPPKVLVPIGVRGVMTAPPAPSAPPLTPPVSDVRDHRGASGAPTLRDHRDSSAGATAPTVRDHRDGSGGAAPATIRDQRDGSATSTAPTVRDHRQQTIAQTRAAAAMLPARAAVKDIDRFQYGVKPEDVQKGAQGPAAAPIELLEGLRTEDIGLNPALLLSIASSVYPDKNPASGVFYYYPRSYHLAWTPESGHALRILYGAASNAGASGDVLMAAQLQSGLDSSEVQLATALLDAYRRRNSAAASNVPAVLRPLPLEKDGVDVSLGAVLGQYSIAKDKIAITGLSDVLGEIEVSWVTDPVTKENLQLALAQDVGVNGSVAFTAAGGALEPQVPIAIQIADRDSFGRVRWNRTDGYRNLTPYPVRLRYLHALVVDPRSNVPILYSWSLGNVEVAPGARVEWDGARVPAWIDTDAKRVWVDYGVVDGCEPCDRRVLDAITGGVTSIAAEQITFHTITPLADIGAYELTAFVRSKYFDPKDRTLRQRSVVLKADNQDFTLGPLYSGAARAGDPLFEYLFEIGMPDGTTHRGTRWIASDNLRVLVGRSQLEQSIGTLPGKQP